MSFFKLELLLEFQLPISKQQELDSFQLFAAALSIQMQQKQLEFFASFIISIPMIQPLVI